MASQLSPNILNALQRRINSKPSVTKLAKNAVADSFSKAAQKKEGESPFGGVAGIRSSGEEPREIAGAPPEAISGDQPPAIPSVSGVTPGEVPMRHGLIPPSIQARGAVPGNPSTIARRVFKNEPNKVGPSRGAIEGPLASILMQLRRRGQNNGLS